ncbi:unnamed protein product [Pleuronectes platessa]|uniref:Uncharacterized protein n=1 Tax=Pleuronectes platessa TaxID=8262 RepID=A0A9N7Z2Y5_PLEPL|nr:unnamed protein product [Pleuronectes platessa]
MTVIKTSFSPLKGSGAVDSFGSGLVSSSARLHNLLLCALVFCSQSRFRLVRSLTPGHCSVGSCRRRPWKSFNMRAASSNPLFRFSLPHKVDSGKHPDLPPLLLPAHSSNIMMEYWGRRDLG